MSQQKPSWNSYFHRDQAYDTTYNNNNNSPVDEPRLSYFPRRQETSYDLEKSPYNNPEDPSFWRTPGIEHANVAPSAPPQESLYGSNSERGVETDEDLARRIYREEQIRYSQGSMGNAGGAYPPRGEAESYYGQGNDMQFGQGPQMPPPPAANISSFNDSKVPEAYRDPRVQSQLQKRRFWRPYFTYLVTLIQLVALIYEFVYNQKETGDLIQTNPFNPLIGPSASPTLIKLGARFVPCMRPLPIISSGLPFQCIDRSLIDPNKGVCTLEELCGLGGFNGGKPNQWFRFIIPIFLHGGVVHFLLNMSVQVITGRQVENDIGWWRYGIIYMSSGIFGFIFGGNFSEPAMPSVGASGSLFGVIGILLIDLLQNWKITYNPCWELTKLLLMIIFSFLLGTLPGIDNFSHIGGFVMGLLMAIVLIPTINFSKTHKRFNWLLRIIALPIAVMMFAVLINNFYNTEDPAKTCPWCKYLSCLPVANWCSPTGITTTTTPP